MVPGRNDDGQITEVSKTIVVDGKEVILIVKDTYHKEIMEESTDLPYDG